MTPPEPSAACTLLPNSQGPPDVHSFIPRRRPGRVLLGHVTRTATTPGRCGPHLPTTPQTQPPRGPIAQASAFAVAVTTSLPTTSTLPDHGYVALLSVLSEPDLYLSTAWPLVLALDVPGRVPCICTGSARPRVYLSGPVWASTFRMSALRGRVVHLQHSSMPSRPSTSRRFARTPRTAGLRHGIPAVLRSLLSPPSSTPSAFYTPEDLAVFDETVLVG